MSEVQVSRRNAFATGTYSNLHTQFKAYLAFCVYFQRDPLPADSETIYAYVQFLSRSLKSPTLRNYLSGVKMLHILLGLPYSHSEDILLKLELRGLARLYPHVPVRAKPVTPDILLIFHHHMDHCSSLHCSVWSCCLLLFYTMARLGSILPASAATASFLFISGPFEFLQGRFVSYSITHQNNSIREKTAPHTFINHRLRLMSSQGIH